MPDPMTEQLYRKSRGGKGAGRFRRWLWRGAGGALLLLVCLALASRARSQGQKRPSDPFAQLHWRFIGPVGNRASAIVGEPGNPAVVYVGAASGGIWKTSDGGVTWKPVFDHTNVSAIGALAVAPSAHNVVWAGTGETWIIRPDYPMGDGVYKSTDAGLHWRHMGLRKTGHIGRIVIDPQNPNHVFVCALGQLFRPQHERGIFRTLNGGKTWQQVLFVNDNTGCSDLAIDPHDPNTLVAGMWQVRVHTWNLDSGGTGGGVYISHDGGNSWHKISGNGLPRASQPVGKVAVAIAPNNPQRVYALIQERNPALYRSDNGGKSWTLVSHNHAMDQRPPYFTRFAVSPDNENLLYFVTVGFVISPDGGRTFFQPGGFGQGRHWQGGYGSPGGDNHDVWIDPLNPKRILVANDGGGAISLNGGKTYQRVVLPIGQVYHVYTDNRIPYDVYGNRQDGPSFRGPSNNLESGFGGGRITTGDFRTIGGCESGFGVPDPVDPNIVWSGCYSGFLTRMNMRTGQARNVAVWPDTAYGWLPSAEKYRWHWTFPIAIDPLDHNRVYVGSQYVMMTTNGGQSWKRISPDLTLNLKSHEGNSGGISYDNLMTYDGAVLYAIAPSPVREGVIWAGSNDGQVSVTEDDGAHWTNVTKNIPNLPPWGTISNIDASPFNAASAYITVNLEQEGDYNAYVYQTTDFGRTWKFISGSVPKGMNSSAHCVIEDPVQRGMLYLGTDNALYVSWDDGGHWTRLRSNLPPAPVYWITIQRHFDDLVVATYGRGIYILDDISPLRNYLTAKTKTVYLFKPRPAYRFRHMDSVRLADAGSHVVGQDPPYGADINFYLASAEKHLRIEILGADGKKIRTLRGDGKQGLNRIWWDLRYTPARKPKLRMPPPGDPWVKNGPQGWRPLVSASVDPVVPGPIVVPGTYTVQMIAAGQTLSAPLQVLPDPHSIGTPASIRSQVAFSLELEREVNQVAAMIDHLEWTRKQLADLERQLGGSPKDQAVVTAARALGQKALAVEGKLVDVHLTGAYEDSFLHPNELYSKLALLLESIDSSLDGGSGSDLGPTAGDLAVNQYYRQWLARSSLALKQLVESDTPAFNRLLKAHGLAMQIEP
jgi:photosystem II stability/assembly factor-like uncharacterized protein